MFPVAHAQCRRDDEGHVHVHIVVANTPVNTAAKDEVVLGISVCKALRIKPSLGEELVRLGVDFRVME